MGLLDLLGYGGNPLYKAFDANRGKITGAFGGLVGSGNDPRAALTGWTHGLQHGVDVDTENALIAHEQQQKKDAVDKETQQQNQTIAWLQKNAPEYADAVANGAMTAPDAWNAVLAAKNPKSTQDPAAIQEYKYSQSQGYTGTFQQYQTDMKRAGATNLTFNNDQSNAAGFADRMKAAEPILEQTESVQADPMEHRGDIPLVGNFIASPKYQEAQQAQRDFVNAVLRKESGAAISDAEFENARKQYFPQPGDGPEVIAQKRKNRATAIANMERSGGPAYNNPAAGNGGFSVISVQ